MAYDSAHISRSFSANSNGYSPQMIEKSALKWIVLATTAMEGGNESLAGAINPPTSILGQPAISMEGNMKPHETNLLLQAKYNITAYFYDILDYPWERVYRQWRPSLVGDLRGKVLEVGVGTGRNLQFYHQDIDLVAIDLSNQMLHRAKKRMTKSKCKVRLVNEDATTMQSINSNEYDWVFSTFMCCVMPDEIQQLAIKQFSRVLKQDGRFRVLEIVFSKNSQIKKRQERLASFVEKVYGARFDRNTLSYFEQSPHLKITNTSYLKDDTYLLIEGVHV